MPLVVPTSGSGPTAMSLIRGLGMRLQEFALSTSPQSGLQTTLIDPLLAQYFPADLNQFYPWVTGVSGCDPANLGVERRAKSWTISSTTLTFPSPGFPGNITQGPYEIHMRYQRSTILEAINDAAGQLGLTWFREMKDESLTTAQSVWKYTLPNSENWSNVTKIEIQIATDELFVAGGYPYAPADFLNPHPQRTVDTLGNELWEIQFGKQPPPDRNLRVWGEAFYNDLIADTDFLPLAGKWLRPAVRWIYSMGSFNLTDWSNNRVPTQNVETARQKALDILERQKNEVLSLAPSHTPGKVLTPGRGDGYAIESPDDWRYLHAFRSAAFIPGGG